MFELYINRILHHYSFMSCFWHLNLCLRDASTAHVAEFIFLFAVLHGNLFITCYILKYAHVLWIRSVVGTREYRDVPRAGLVLREYAA